MVRRWARWGFVGAVLLSSLALGQPAQAQTAPSGSVTPNTGLTDQQVVTVQGAGLPEPIIPNGYVVSQCDAANLGPSPGIIEALAFCDLGPGSVSNLFPVEGRISTPFTVRQVINLDVELFFPDEEPVVDCRVRSCSILIAQVTAEGFTTIVLPISFGPEAPTTKAACKDGGWRLVADDQGRAFRNQGQCIRFVNGQR